MISNTLTTTRTLNVAKMYGRKTGRTTSYSKRIPTLLPNRITSGRAMPLRPVCTLTSVIQNRISSPVIRRWRILSHPLLNSPCPLTKSWMRKMYSSWLNARMLHLRMRKRIPVLWRIGVMNPKILKNLISPKMDCLTGILTCIKDLSNTISLWLNLKWWISWSIVCSLPTNVRKSRSKLKITMIIFWSRRCICKLTVISSSFRTVQLPTSLFAKWLSFATMTKRWPSSTTFRTGSLNWQPISTGTWWSTKCWKSFNSTN